MTNTPEEDTPFAPSCFKCKHSFATFTIPPTFDKGYKGIRPDCICTPMCSRPSPYTLIGVSDKTLAFPCSIRRMFSEDCGPMGRLFEAKDGK